MKPHVPPVTPSILDMLRKLRRPGEGLMDTAKRVLVHEALERCFWSQKEAGKLLGATPRTMNYWCADLQIRPIDRKRKEAS